MSIQSHGGPSGRRPAFLLVIPGCTTVGLGLGLLLSNPAPWTLMGLGLGATIWGLILAFRRK